MFPDLVRDDIFRLETARLWLRWPRAQDVAFIAESAQDPVLIDRIPGFAKPYLEGAAAEFILKARKSNADGEALNLILAPKRRPGDAIGCVALSAAAATTMKLSFWLGRQHWGQGLMQESIRSLVDLTFGFTDCESLQAHVPGLNPAALRLLSEAGFLPKGGSAPAERFEMDRARWRLVAAWPCGGGEAILAARRAPGAAC